MLTEDMKRMADEQAQKDQVMAGIVDAEFLADTQEDLETWAIRSIVEMLWRSGDYTPEMRRRILAYLTARNEEAHDLDVHLER